MTPELRVLMLADRNLEAPPEVEARLTEAFRNRAAAPGWGWVAIAAGILMVAGAVASRGGRPENPAAPAAVTPRRVTTGFLPVMYGEDLNPWETRRLVRVRLPRTALSYFGVPVNENRIGERVEADVLIGEDGTARAVRFVQ